MQTKNRDTLYCCVNEYKIKNAEPELDWYGVHFFKEFVIDRYKIHKRKDVAHLEAPWTKNPILKDYKFTNVRREHDRQTRYLLENITNNPELSLEDKIVNSILFRCWNNWSTCRDFGFPYSAEELYNPKLKNKIRPKYAKLDRQDPKRLWYSNAYNQGGTKCAWKFAGADMREVPYKFGNDIELGDNKYEDYEKDIPLRPFHVGVWLGRREIVHKLLTAENQEEAFNVLKSLRGFADFLAYQVFVDLTYIPEFPFSENEFTVAGPGCKKGIDHIFIDTDGMTYEECIFWLRDAINSESHSLFKSEELREFEETYELKRKRYNPDRLFNDLPEYDRCMNVMSIENCMCELSKYMRVVTGKGTPRNRYKSHKED